MSLHDNCVARFDRFVKLLGLEVEVASPEFARVKLERNPSHLNVWGAAHGGIICTLIDVAFGIAANDDQETAVVTLSTNVEFLRAGLIWPLVAESTATRRGRRILNYDVKVLNGEKSMIAHALVSGYVTDLPLPGEYTEKLRQV